MVNYLCVFDRPCKVRTQVFGLYMPVTCSPTPDCMAIICYEGDSRVTPYQSKTGDQFANCHAQHTILLF